MKQNWFNTFFLIAILISCIDEEEIDRSYPTIVTNSVTEILPSGATFSGRIESSSLDEISEHGFVWGQDDKLLPENSFSLKFGKPTSNLITTKIKSSLVAQKVYYARFYIKTDDKTIYGNLVTFKSLGSEGPIITALRPASGVLGDTVIIRGRNFVAQEEKNVVKFGSEEVSIESLTDSTISVIVPEDLSLDSEHVNVSVSIEGNVANSPEPFTLLLSKIIPVIESVIPLAIKACDTVVVIGKNFKSTLSPFSVLLLNNEEVNLIKATDDSVVFSIKMLPSSDFNFIIKTGRFEIRPSIDFTELRPEFVSFSPANYKPGSIVKVEVKNFPSCLPFFVSAAGSPLEIISRTENMIEVKISTYCCCGNPIPIWFGPTYYNPFLETPYIPAEPPKIISVEPNHGVANQEIVIKGENFFSLQNYYYDLLNITSYTENEIRGTIREVYAPTGLVDVIINACGQTAILENGFQYDTPVILDINPKIITSPDQIVTITGKNFSPGMSTNLISLNNGEHLFGANSDDGNQLTFLANSLIPDALIETTLDAPFTVRTGIGMEVASPFNLVVQHTGPWKKLKDFPGEARLNGISFSINGKGYIGLGDGVTDWYTTHLTDLWEFDPATEDWTQKASFPGNQAYDNNLTSVAEGKAYHLTLNSKQFWEYSPSADVWNRMADYPGKGEFSTISISVNNKIYMGGGSFGYGIPTNDFWEFDPTQNTWQRKSDIPENLTQYKVCYEMDEEIHGFTTNAANQNLLITYNPSTDLWTTQPNNFIQEKSVSQIFKFDSKIVVSTNYGYDGDRTMYLIDQQNNSWITKQSYTGPIPRSYYLGFTIGQTGYIGFGAGGNSQRLKDFWKFDPEKF